MKGQAKSASENTLSTAITAPERVADITVPKVASIPAPTNANALENSIADQLLKSIITSGLRNPTLNYLHVDHTENNDLSAIKINVENCQGELAKLIAKNTTSGHSHHYESYDYMMQYNSDSNIADTIQQQESRLCKSMLSPHTRDKYAPAEYACQTGTHVQRSNQIQEQIDSATLILRIEISLLQQEKMYHSTLKDHFERKGNHSGMIGMDHDFIQSCTGDMTTIDQEEFSKQETYDVTTLRTFINRKDDLTTETVAETIKEINEMYSDNEPSKIKILHSNHKLQSHHIFIMFGIFVSVENYFTFHFDVEEPSYILLMTQNAPFSGTD